MEVKVKLLSGDTLSVVIPPESSVLDLKQRLKERTDVPEDRQRLIYRGRVLQDAHTLTQSGLEDGHTLHCVVKPIDAPRAPPEAGPRGAAVAGEPAGSGRRVFVGGSSVLRDTRLLSDLIRPLGDSATVPVRAGREGPNPSSLEHIRQGLLTMHTVLSGMDGPAAAHTAAAATEGHEASGTALFGPSVENGAAAAHAQLSQNMCRRRRFFVGQWLDVKDTVNQWLEATVMEIDAEGGRLKIHYNGWPTRWDEFISSDSQRIAPFRTRTIHMASAPNVVSPMPVSSVRNAPVTGEDDVRVVLPEVLGMMRVVSSYLEQLAGLCEADLMGSEAEGERPWLQTSPWEAERAREERRRRRRLEGEQQRREQMEAMPVGDEDQKVSAEDDQPTSTGSSSSATTTTATANGEPPRRRKRPLQAVAADVAPLLDRCGRLLADLAPHVSSLASMEGVEDDEEAEELGRGTTEAASTVAEMSVSGSTSSAGQPGVAEPRTTGHSTRTGRSTTRERGGPRSRTPSPDTAYRQLISVPARGAAGVGMPGLGSNIDIHIHAFLTPLRTSTTTTTTAAGVGAPPSTGTGPAAPQPTAGASGAANPTSGMPSLSQAAADQFSLLSQALGLASSAASVAVPAPPSSQGLATAAAFAVPVHEQPSAARQFTTTAASAPSSTSAAGSERVWSAAPDAYYGVMSHASLLASPSNSHTTQAPAATTQPGAAMGSSSGAPLQVRQEQQQVGNDDGSSSGTSGASHDQQPQQQRGGSAGGIGQIFSLLRRFSS